MQVAENLTLESGEYLDSKYAPAVPIVCASSHRFAANLSSYLFNEFKLCASISILPGTSDETPNPYVLVLNGSRSGSPPATQSVKLARAVCFAYARGISAAHCY